jgi:sugar phosphate isomerase/epimerase
MASGGRSNAFLELTPPVPGAFAPFLAAESGFARNAGRTPACAVPTQAERMDYQTRHDADRVDPPHAASGSPQVRRNLRETFNSPAVSFDNNSCQTRDFSQERDGLMQIRYAVSTMVFWWREHPLSFEQECDYLRSLGFGIELWPNLRGQNECRYERRNWARLQSATEGMRVSLRSRTDSPTLEQWEEQIQCAALLGANVVTEPGSLGIPDGAELNGTGFAAEVVRMAEANGVTVCLETGPLPTLLHIGREFDSLRYCLDTGFAHIDREHSFREYVDALAPRVTHLHLTDNYGKTDDHEPPGLHGGIPRENWDYLLDVLDRCDNEITASFEMCPCMPSVMIRQASEYVFDVLKWPNRPEKQAGHDRLAYHPT